ncbi:MAG: asparagine synthase (glutamine-hydrolyzing), partial [Candidatus Calescibacterium sp.]|nr:asparagine synthase (glutamine-hydrolyzing) [Candidatus Calescibacterium sp.]
MCGILGVISNKQNLNRNLSSLNKLSHRGPDDVGFYYDNNVFLGQRRLSIIDLSSAGKQPMFLKCKKTNRNLALVFNGEIYNYQDLRKELESLGHRFFSNSDTEVILHSYEEWNVRSFERFRGMFACGLYDIDNKEFIVFRDRFGIKPIYYYIDGKNFIFASELKAFWVFDFIKKEPDQTSILKFLKFGYIREPYTFYNKIFCLEAGHFLRVKINDDILNFEKQKWTDILDYYQLPEEEISLGEATSRTKDALLDSIRYHLIADVPVGLFLSGGIDSSVLLYLIRELGQEKIQTISAVFPNTSYDESEKINELVKIFRPAHIELKIDSKDFLDNLENIFYHMDQPTVDGVNTYFVSLIAKKAGLKVVLSGLGGDELFYGYPSFFDLPKIRRIKKILIHLKISSLLDRFFDDFDSKYRKLSKIIMAKNLG